MSNDFADGKFGIRIENRKRKPKKNPVEYELRTIDDLFKIVTPENANRLFKDLKKAALSKYHINKIIDTIAGANNVAEFDVKTERFIWIDD